MLLLFLLLSPFEVLCLDSTSPHKTLLSPSVIATHLIRGFKDYPLVVWTTEKELFPDLAEILIKESQKQFHPVELRQWSVPSWPRTLKFAAGKPFYTVFPPTLSNHSNNIMLGMLANFTHCDKLEFGDFSQQMEDIVFLFLSTLYDGSQEEPSIMRDGQKYCTTPANVLFLKYDFRFEQNPLVELQSLRAIRMRCSEIDDHPCNDIVHANESNQVLSYLSSQQLRNLIQVVWRKNYATHVFIENLARREPGKEYGRDWETLKEVFIDPRIRDLRQLPWLFVEKVPFFELVRQVNISVTALIPWDYDTVKSFWVGSIDTGRIPENYWSGLSFLHSNHFNLIYGADYAHGYNPFTASTLYEACGALGLTYILGFILLITILRMLNYRWKDFIGVLHSTIAPLLFRYHPYRSIRLNILGYIWMVSIWFSTVMYLSLLQSQRISPIVEVENTFTDLQDHQMSFYAGYDIYSYFKDQKEDPPEVQTGIVPRLARIVQEKQYWDVRTQEFKNFFKLSNMAVTVNSVDVKPTRKVLMDAYSKNYLVLPEKIFVPAWWAEISIPQGEYVVEAFKLIKESGIWEYWYQTFQEKRGDQVVSDFWRKFKNETKLWKAPETFSQLNMSDSVLLEIITLLGMIISAMVATRIALTLTAKLGVRGWIRNNISQLMRWVAHSCHWNRYLQKAGSE